MYIIKYITWNIAAPHKRRKDFGTKLGDLREKCLVAVLLYVNIYGLLLLK